MIIRDLDDERQTHRCVESSGWQSVRLLLEADHMGFSFHITAIHAGAQLTIQYQHHLEAVYCISGAGTIEDITSGKEHSVRPGILYALDQHDRHVLTAKTHLLLACVFNPPLTGREVHDETGAYPRNAQAQ